MLPVNTQQTSELIGVPTFRKGDEVFVAKGSYKGTAGIFLKLRGDRNWADILEQDLKICMLAHTPWNGYYVMGTPVNLSSPLVRDSK